MALPRETHLSLLLPSPLFALHTASAAGAAPDRNSADRAAPDRATSDRAPPDCAISDCAIPDRATARAAARVAGLPRFRHPRLRHCHPWDIALGTAAAAPATEAV